MAPSKTTTTTKKKTATTTTTTTTSSKVKVHRSTNQPRPRATPLPDDWPVASVPPQFSAEQSALTPGSLLQELCSGQDIHINKQALVAPSISKEKGRYLLILPGVFSFKPIKQASSTSVATTTTATNSASAEPTQEEPLPALTQTQDSEDVLGNTNQDESDDDDDDNDEPGKESTATTTTTNNNNKPKSSIPQLGNLEGLATPHPKLRISFPALQKSLVFPGTKVHTSSKYMWLNCAARKKGTVTCKVRSVVIFHDWTESSVLSGKLILILVCVYGVYCLGYLFVCHCVWSTALGNRGRSGQANLRTSTPGHYHHFLAGRRRGSDSLWGI